MPSRACIAAALFTLSVGLTGCASSSVQQAEMKTQDAAHAKTTMAMLAKLDGEWELANPTEEMPEGRTIFEVSSASFQQSKAFGIEFFCRSFAEVFVTVFSQRRTRLFFDFFGQLGVAFQHVQVVEEGKGGVTLDIRV